MPLLFGITPEDKRAAVINALRKSILVKQKGHLNTGMHGTYFMTRYLTDTDNNDLIFAPVASDRLPGWAAASTTVERSEQQQPRAAAPTFPDPHVGPVGPRPASPLRSPPRAPTPSPSPPPSSANVHV